MRRSTATRGTPRTAAFSEGLSSGEFLSSRNHDVIGVDIIHALVGQPMPSTHHVAAIGHVFVNALSAETLERIMSQEACPKLLAATRRLAGWQLFRVGVFRVGAYAAQERELDLGITTPRICARNSR